MEKRLANSIIEGTRKLFTRGLEKVREDPSEGKIIGGLGLEKVRGDPSEGKIIGGLGSGKDETFQDN
eukprot:12431542-Karenia_brevis.AAC.2